MYYKVLKGLLACSLATTVFAPIALATNAESRDQSWLDRTDILIKAQENRKPQLAVETLQPISHYNKNSKGFFSFKARLHLMVGMLIDLTTIPNKAYQLVISICTASTNPMNPLELLVVLA